MRAFHHGNLVSKKADKKNMGEKIKGQNLFEEFAEVETEKAYDGYFFSIKSAIIITICGMFCRLQNMKGIHMWATNERIKEFLKECFAIEFIPCYSWVTQVLGFIKPASFSEAFTKWIVGLLEAGGSKTLSLDKKNHTLNGENAAL